jgi:hypothetical protein
MRVSEQIALLNVIKTTIRDAINSKGVEAAEDEPFSAYASKITQIQSGGGSAIPPPVFDPPPGRYPGFATISLSAESGDIYFFADERQDPAGATQYSQPIGIDVSRTITAFAYDRDTREFSNAITAHYYITGYEYEDFLGLGVMVEEEVVLILKPEDIVLRIEDVLPAGINNITETVDTIIE